MDAAAAQSLVSSVLWGGFALAFVLGALANWSNFCTMGAVADIVNMGHWGRMRMWMLAAAVALAGTTLLASSGQVDLAATIYQRPSIPLVSLVVGGLLFGVGMTLAGGCANKNLVRIGGGSIRSLVVVAFVAISAVMTLKGLFGQWRASWLDPLALDLTRFGLPDQSLASVVARAAGVAPAAALAATGLVLAAALAAFVFADARFRRNALQIAGGAGIGAVIVAGWWLTGHLGYGENPETLETMSLATQSRAPESMSFVGPLAFGLELLMRWTDRSLHVTFGIVSALGVVAGSLAAALALGRFAWEGFASIEDLGSQIVGAVLMGFGGITAIGCTIGQGLSGVSTLAIGSVIAIASIVAGCAATLKFMLWRAERA